jgi:predicted phosphate transport protein (TIGR00153 family)
MFPPFKEDFDKFLLKNLETFKGAQAIMHELHQLLESSFGGNEAEKVRAMVDEVAYHEHEADLIQHSLLKKLYNIDKEMNFSTFLLWQKIFQAIGDISNLSEKLANRVRMTLDLK